MRYALCSLAVIIALASCGEARAQPRASVAFGVFFAEAAPYLEVYVTAERASLQADRDRRRSLDLLLTLTHAEVDAGDDSIALADHVTMWSPITDTVSNFMEALRYSVPPGLYTLRLELRDPQVSEGQLPLKLATPITVREPADGLQLSDIQLVASRTPVDERSAQSSLVKGGYVLEPLAGNLVRRQMDGLSAYVEIYNSVPDSPVAAVLEHNIARLEADGEAVDIFRKTKRLTEGAPVVPVFVNFKTTSLPSGQYFLSTTLRDRALQIIDQRYASFYVANPAADVLADRDVPEDGDWVGDIPADSLDYVLLSLIPISSVDQTPIVEASVKSVDEAYKRRTILNHFVGMSSTAPAKTYREYMDVVRQVDIAFQSGFGRGFQTDRGHIWLKYGQPDDRIEVNNDPSAPPYEIWVYNYVERTQQTPGKFLFYNPTLDNANYLILHSDIRGEIRNPRWRRDLYSKAQASEFGDNDSVQGMGIGDNVGRYADQYFTDN